MERQTGGKNGGGAVLTPFGLSLVARYRKIERAAAGAVRKELMALRTDIGRPQKAVSRLTPLVRLKFLKENIVSHPALSPNNVAVITGGASGIGLAAATHFARIGMKVCIADIGKDRLAEAAATIIKAAPGGEASVMTAVTDVSSVE